MNQAVEAISAAEQAISGGTPDKAKAGVEAAITQTERVAVGELILGAENNYHKNQQGTAANVQAITGSSAVAQHLADDEARFKAEGKEDAQSIPGRPAMGQDFYKAIMDAVEKTRQDIQGGVTPSSPPGAPQTRAATPKGSDLPPH
jgi:hypothetical protein